jgi:hypothetical protein
MPGEIGFNKLEVFRVGVQVSKSINGRLAIIT